MRILTFTSLFPNAQMPRLGIFVRERLRQLMARHPVEATVVAPVPWFPSAHPRWGRYGQFAGVPRRESQGNLQVHHPRFVTLPKLGNAANPLAMALSAQRWLKRTRIDDFDLIDAHYAFPDGVAAALMARRLRKPLVLTVRGSDINVLPHELAAGRWLRATLRRCDAVIAVSRALADRVHEIEPSLDGRIHVLRNGVDRNRFAIRPTRDGIRGSLGWVGPVVLSVGNLLRMKGHHIVVRALKELPEVTLGIVGAGPEDNALRHEVEQLGLTGRVVFFGSVDQDALIDLYNAADALVLASSSEGMPNVVLEALACGTPVVATDVGDVREVLNPPEYGHIVRERTPQGVAAGIRAVLARRVTRESIRERAASFGWDRTCDGIYETFSSVLARHCGCAAATGARG